jgi:hypothetical protein
MNRRINTQTNREHSRLEFSSTTVHQLGRWALGRVQIRCRRSIDHISVWMLKSRLIPRLWRRSSDDVRCGVKLTRAKPSPCLTCVVGTPFANCCGPSGMLVHARCRPAKRVFGSARRPMAPEFPWTSTTQDTMRSSGNVKVLARPTLRAI